MLGVDAALIAEHGAVSEAVARAMALGALRTRARRAERGGDRHRRAGRRHARQAGGHGVAGRGRAAARPGAPQVTALRLQLDGDRAAVREQTVRLALQRLHAALG